MPVKSIIELAVAKLTGIPMSVFSDKIHICQTLHHYCLPFTINCAFYVNVFVRTGSIFEPSILRLTSSQLQKSYVAINIGLKLSQRPDSS